jgi:hypothetical protein
VFFSRIKEVKDGNEINSYDILKALTAEDNKTNVNNKLTNTYFLS